MKINLKDEKNLVKMYLEGTLNRQTSYKINRYLIPVIIKKNIKNVLCIMDKLNIEDYDGYESIKNIKCAVESNKGNILIEGVNEKIKYYSMETGINLIDKKRMERKYEYR